jgi:hypothetical protein
MPRVVLNRLTDLACYPAQMAHAKLWRMDIEGYSARAEFGPTELAVMKFLAQTRRAQRRLRRAPPERCRDTLEGVSIIVWLGGRPGRTLPQPAGQSMLGSN